MAMETVKKSKNSWQLFCQFSRGIFPCSVCIVLLFCLTGLSRAEEKSFNDFADAVEFLAKEQSLAETYATILKEFGRKDIEKFARGIELYGKAKADYDALIARLQFDLVKGNAPDASAEFQQKLDKAAVQCVEFTNFVAKEFIMVDPKARAAAGALAVITTVQELLPPLLDAGIKIWQEYLKGNAQEKQQIIDQLDSYRWKMINEIK